MHGSMNVKSSKEHAKNSAKKIIGDKVCSKNLVGFSFNSKVIK
jgi:hypothetical protein